ncbi:MAG: hypothetical protein K5918_02550 [Bacteroidales bacterium]|nr:hypothetical protein [Bacteroidales bacterium]
MSEKESFDWKRMLLRKDRPLPKAGCSWAFYIVLLLMVIYLIVMFVKYQKQL